MYGGEAHDELSQLKKWISNARLERDWSNLGLSGEEELAVANQVDRLVERVKDLAYAEEVENDSRFRSIMRSTWLSALTMGFGVKTCENVSEFFKSNWHDLACALSVSVLSGEFGE